MGIPAKVTELGDHSARVHKLAWEMEGTTEGRGTKGDPKGHGGCGLEKKLSCANPNGSERGNVPGPSVQIILWPKSLLGGHSEGDPVSWGQTPALVPAAQEN